MKNLVKNSLLCLSALCLLAGCNNKQKQSGPKKPTFPVKVVTDYFTENGLSVKVPKLTINDPNGSFSVSEGLMGGPMVTAQGVTEEEITSFIGAFVNAGWVYGFEVMDESDVYYEFGEIDAWVEIMTNSRFNYVSFDFCVGLL